MTLDRAELAGTGAALAFHVALIAAMSLSLAHVASVPEPPSMEVEFVEDVGLTAAAPNQLTTPPPASQAPEIGEAEPVEPMPAPVAAQPAPSPRPVVKPTPARPAPARPAPRASRIGDDFLKGIADSPSQSSAPARPAAAKFDANALASIQQAIRRQVQPCADRQVDPGNGANRIRVTLNIRLNRSGRLNAPPRVVRTSGVDDENSRYEERVKDLAVAAYTGCAPLNGLPAELYQTAQGGWSNINMTYRLP